MSQPPDELNICSLLPSGTEILFALGLGDQVVGVSDLCDYPPEARDKRVVSRSKVDASVLTSEQVENQIGLPDLITPLFQYKKGYQYESQSTGH